MKTALFRPLVALKSGLTLGFPQTFWYAIYQVGLRSGIYRRATPVQPYQDLAATLRSPFRLPEQSQLETLLPPGSLQRQDLIAEAEEVSEGLVRLFGGPPVALELGQSDHRLHWTAYERRPDIANVEDFKYVWEPARFGWAYPLGRAYLLTGDERYPAAYWRHLETFLASNPPNQGPNWSSAQEVALRLLAMLFAVCVFERSGHTTPERLASLAGAVAAHAMRIPVTIAYARAQNNNHLITEALGLYAAGFALPEFPSAQKWTRQGWHWLNQAFQSQIQPDGVYVQHSMNYHRLMLHSALEAQLMGQAFPPAVRKRLAASTRWLLAQVDPGSGRAPNLGSNDGANILPLSSGGLQDYRPAAQAAARAFLGQPAFPPGPWDESGLWLSQDLTPVDPLRPLPSSPGVLRLGDADNWATLRAARFTGRPAHADQLHVDLWWRGENIALDAGTYRYTAPPPWDNALSHTFPHNTIEVNQQSQMTRAGRFLWLDWAQARPLNTKSSAEDAIAAQHNGYRRLGVIHSRMLERLAPDTWRIADHLLSWRAARPGSPRNPVYPYTLSWLLPDWPWMLDEQTLIIYPPAGGRIILIISPALAQHPGPSIQNVGLVRAGRALAGAKKVSPAQGWYSPTYGYKEPALSFSITVHSSLPFAIFSDWKLEP